MQFWRARSVDQTSENQERALSYILCMSTTPIIGLDDSTITLDGSLLHAIQWVYELLLDTPARYRAGLFLVNTKATVEGCFGGVIIRLVSWLCGVSGLVS